ncbi:MAG: zf-HC2 domain-containing protein [Betaproteobacteria bacterium]|nr:zf-HC2 domain-containing protein [Betaproteobacteria bacterium]
MITCKQASELVSRTQEGPLSLREKLSLRLHLLICDGCARFAKQVNFLREAMQRYRQ